MVWRLTAVHSILRVKQSPWMREYIDHNTKKRAEATNDANKNFFKLMINAAYGKTIENKRNRMKLRIVGSEIDFIKYGSRPSFIGYKKIRKEYYIINEKQLSITLDKPIYVGCTVLELSKLAMYKFWYDVIKKQCDNPKILYMDTNSFIFEYKENFRDIMLEHKEFYDLSNQPRDSKYYCPDNKKVPGKMKDESPGQTITQFIGLKQ